VSMSRTVNRPDPPRPLFETLPSAVRAAIAHGNSLPDINLTRWSATYHCGVEDVKAAWEKAQWIATQKPVEWEGDK